MKLKTFEFINSSEEGKPDYEVFKKKLKKDKLLYRYIDKLKSKNLTVQDYRLLSVLGFDEGLKLLLE